MGCWTKSYRMRLQFTIARGDIKQNEKLLVYAALAVPSANELGEVHVSMGKPTSTPITRTMKSKQQIIAASFRVDTSNTLPNGLLPMQMELVLHPRSGTKVPLPTPSDSRVIGFGLRSFLVTRESDIQTRQAIIERILL